MKRRSYLFVIAALLCGAWFWAFWSNGPKEGKASSAVHGDVGKETVAISAGKDTVPANSGNDPERFVYDGEHFGSKQAMEQAKKQDYIDLHGADAKITLHVTDSSGRNVPDAAVKADFGVFEKSTSTTGKTDGNGMFIWNGRTDGEVVYTVEKDGYYKTRTAYRLNLINGDDVKDGKWIPWNRTINVTLKERRNPVPMYYEGRCEVYVPKGEMVGFDCGVGDLVAPHGKGVTADFQFAYTAGRSGETLAYVTNKLIVVTRNAEGFATRKKDAASNFKFEYIAPLDGYKNEVVFEFERTIDKIFKDTTLPNDEYLVFRSRIETDENDNITQANYGIIASLRYSETRKDANKGVVILEYYFNPTPNDRNLEYGGNLFDERRRR